VHGGPSLPVPNARTAPFRRGGSRRT
jgi:hypothetical protein